MATVAKNIGNTGSTHANRVVFDFRAGDETMNLATVEFQPINAHSYTDSMGNVLSTDSFNVRTAYSLSRIKHVLNYSGATQVLTIGTDVISFGSGTHDFSDIGGLPLTTPLSSRAGPGVATTATAPAGLVVEFRA